MKKRRLVFEIFEGIFLKIRSLSNARWFYGKKRKIGKRNLYLTENRLSWNEICCAADKIPFQMRAWSCVTSYSVAGFTLSYARYGKPRNGSDVMQLHARIWKGHLKWYVSHLCKRNFRFERQLNSYWQNIKFSRNCPKFHIFSKIVIFKVYLQLFRPTASSLWILWQENVRKTLFSSCQLWAVKPSILLDFLLIKLSTRNP